MPGDQTPLPTSAEAGSDSSDKRPLQAASEALERLRFGVVQLTVHDGKVVQLDVTERRRFT